MDIEIKVEDSYLNTDAAYWERLGEFYSQNVWNLTPEEAAERVQLCFSSFEYEYAVKWFEISAYSKNRLVGFMRVMRDPENDTRWFFADVHTAKKHRHKGIATQMYEAAIGLVSRYEAAKTITASVSPSNENSVKLHQKMGFVDTGRFPCFADFEFEDETEYEYLVLNRYPAIDGPVHRRILYRLMKQYMKSQGMSEGKPSDRVKAMFKEAKENEKVIFDIIWNGNDPAGFAFSGDESIEFINITGKCVKD